MFVSKKINIFLWFTCTFLVSSNILYFDSNSLIEGDGTIEKPVKTINWDNLSSFLEISMFQNSSMLIKNEVTIKEKKNISIFGNDNSGLIFSSKGKMLINQSNITFNSTFFVFKESSQLHLFYIDNESYVIFENCYFEKQEIKTIIRIFYFSNSIILIKNFKFEKNEVSFAQIIRATNSSLIIENISFIDNLIIINEPFMKFDKYSFVLIQNIILNSSNFSSINKNSLINFNCNFVIMNLMIKNCSFQNIVIFNNSNDDLSFHFIILKKVRLELINQNTQSLFPLLLEIHSINSDIYFFDFSFLNIMAYNSIISIFQNYYSILMRNFTFDNCLSKNALMLMDSDKLFIINFFIENENRLTFFTTFRMGSAISIENVKETMIENLTLINSTSDYTTIGLKFINHDPFKSKYILLNNLNLGLNFVYYSTNYEYVAGVLFFKTDASIFISNSYFFGNLLDTSYTVFNRIGGPCIFVDSTSAELTITSSKFEDNMSKLNSNAIQFQGEIFNMNYCIFLNNTFIYDQVDLENLKKFGNSFSRKQQSHNFGFGGAVLITSHNIIIDNCYFAENQAFDGGAVYITKHQDFNLMKILINSTIFKKNLAGYSGGAIFVSYLVSNVEMIVENNYFFQNEGKYGGVIILKNILINRFIVIRRNIFYLNIGEYSSCIMGNYVKGTLTIRENVFWNNSVTILPGKINPIMGICVLALGDYYFIIEMEFNIFLENFSQIIGGVAVLSGCILVAQNEKLFYTTVLSNTAGYVLYSLAKMSLNDTLIESSTSRYKTGIFSIYDISYAEIYNCTIINSKSVSKGGVFFITENGALLCRNSTIINSFSELGGVMYLMDCSDSMVVFENTIFLNNTGLETIFTLIKGNFRVKNCSFTDNFGLLFDLRGTTMLIENTLVRNANCSSKTIIGCFVSLVDMSSFKSNSINVSNFFSITKGTLIYSESSDSILIDSHFNNIVAETLESVSIFLSSNSFLIGINISEIIPSFGALTSSRVSIENCSFDNSKNYKKILISELILQYSTIILENSNFTNNFAKKDGGFIYGFNSKQNDFNSNIFIISSLFENGTSPLQGGAIYVMNFNLFLLNSIFKRNEAKNGGAVFFSLSNNSSNHIFFLEKSNFIWNKAQYGGGALFTHNCLPFNFNDSCSFFNNIADYGNNTATFSLKIFYKVLIGTDETNSSEEYDSEKNSSTIFSKIKDEVSGESMLHTIILRYVDQYNQTDTSISNRLESLDITNSKNINESVILIGANSFGINRGILKISNIIIISAPSSLISLSFLSSVLPNYLFEIKISFRECVPGEIHDSLSNSCKKCPFNKVSYFPLAKTCEDCPEGAICMGGTNLFVKEGYWRRNKTSLLIYECLESKLNCLGGENSECLNDFTGALCRSCHKGFYPVGYKSCLSCESSTLNYLRFMGLILAAFVMMLVLIKSSTENINIYDKLIARMDESEQISKSNGLLNFSESSLYVKIIVNFAQMISIINNVNIDWPIYIEDIGDFMQYFNSISVKYMGLECILDFEKALEIAPYLNFLAIILMPFFFSVVSYFVWKIYQKIKKNIQIKDYLYATISGIYLMIQPNVMEESLNALRCIEIEGRSFLKINPDFSCEAEEYKIIGNYLAWPIFLTWSFVIPIFIFLVLLYNKNRLYEPATFKRASFFFIGYKTQFFYWDILLALRKSFFSLIHLLIKNNEYLKLLIFLIIIGGYYEILERKQPFMNSSLNKLEYLSALVIFLVIYFTLLLSFLKEKYKYFPFVIFLAILLLYILFLGYWLFSYGKYAKKKYKTYSDKILINLKTKVGKFFKNKKDCIIPLIVISGNEKIEEVTPNLNISNEQNQLIITNI